MILDSYTHICAPGARLLSAMRPARCCGLTALHLLMVMSEHDIQTLEA
jgi:hypothetical protein